MPFGLSNARSVYSRMLDLALANLPVEYWLTYLDDILVYSMDTWDHLKHLKSFMEAHTKAGIKIFQTETEYLGHKVSQGGVQMLNQYVKDIQSWPRPTSCKEMSSFLVAEAGFSAGRIQVYPDFNLDEPFSLTKDWSSLDIAGVLSQNKDGVERFLDC